MSTKTDLALDSVEAIGRASVYSLLASGLALPTSDRLWVLGTVLVPAVEALELPKPLDEALAATVSHLPTDLDRARVDHMALFPPIASQDAPSYETAYRGEGIFQQTAILADIAGFYRAHGLRAGGTERERLDHIAVELEFMAIVARKQALAIREGSVENAQICSETAAAFLRDHLGCWAPAFGRRAAAVTASDWYRGLGELAALWVEEDASMQGVSPVEIVEEPLPQDPPDDGVCGPCPTPGTGGLP